MGLEWNQTDFLVQRRTTGGLPRPIANTTNDYKVGLNKRIIGSSIYWRYQLVCFSIPLTEIHSERPYCRPFIVLGRCWTTIIIATNWYWRRATSCKRWCQISKLTYNVMHKDLESMRTREVQTCWNIHIVWMTILWEAYEMDARLYMIDHHWRVWYQEQKLQFMLNSQVRFINADRAGIWLT